MAYNIFERWPFTSFQDLNLDWLMKAMKEANEQSHDASEKANRAFEIAQQLKDFVNNYFDNLDLQAEINTKIDEMVESGEFERILESSSIADDINHIVSTVVEGWLNEHVTPAGSAVVVDASLTLSGAAADAKVTGDMIRATNGKSDLIAEFSSLIIDPSGNINNAGIINSDGSINYNVNDSFVTDYIRIPAIPEGRALGFSVRAFKIGFYQEDHTFISVNTQRLTYIPVDLIPANTAFIRLMVEPSSTGITYKDVIHCSIIKSIADNTGKQATLILPNQTFIKTDDVKNIAGITTAADALKRAAADFLDINDDFMSLVHCTWGQYYIYRTLGYGEVNDTTTITCNELIKFPDGCHVSVREGYQYQAYRYDIDGTYTGIVSGWLDSGESYDVGGNYLYRIAITKAGGISINESSALLVYSKNQKPTFFPRVKGRRINTEAQRYNIEKTSITIPSGDGGINAFDFHKNYYIQLFADNNAALTNLDTGVVVNFTISCGHGNSCQFSNEFYDTNDTLPLLYCGAWNSNLVYVNRIDPAGSATLIKTYDISEINAYRHNIAVNDKNLITLSYHDDNSYLAGNYSIISLWDLSRAVEENGIYKPYLVKSTPMSMIIVQQDAKWFDGRMFVISGFPEDDIMRIRGINLDGIIETELDDLGSLTNTEPEGLAFWLPENSKNYKLMISSQSGIKEISIEN